MPQNFEEHLMQTNLTLTSLLISLLALPLNLVALQVPMPAYNIEVVGFITINGQAAQHVKVELRKDSCFGDMSSFTWTDEKGFYRLFEPVAPVNAFGGLSEPVYIYVGTGSSARADTYDSYCLFEGLRFKSSETRNTHNKQNHSIILKKNQITAANYKSKPNPAMVACATKDGVWGELKPKQFGCNVKFKDAAKSCTDAKQCSSNVCFFSEPQYGVWLPASMRPKPTGFCAVDTYQVLNKRPGSIDGEYQAGKLILYPH